MQVQQSQLVKVFLSLGLDSATEWDVPTLVSKTNRDGGIARLREPGQAMADAGAEKLYDAIVADQAAGNLVEVVPDPEPEPAAPETFTLGEEPAAPAAIPPVEPTPVEPAPAPKKTRVRTGKTAKASRAAKAKGGKARAAKTAGAATATKEKPKPKAKARGGKAKPSRHSEPSGNGKRHRRTWDEFKKAWHRLHPEGTAALTKRAVLANTVVEQLKEAGRNKEALTKEELLDILKEKFPDRAPEKMFSYVSNLVPSKLRDWNGIHVWKKRREDGRTGYYIKGAGREPQPAAKE